jgi:tripartite-type tricarboxylate transporter receptor subunit TctC
MWKQIEQHYGIKTRSVTYDGGGQALIGILGGHVMVTHGAPTTMVPQIKAGKVRALAFSAPKRHSDLPDIPSSEEAGYGFTTVGSWKGILVPKGTPRPVIDKIALGFKKMTEHPQAISTLRKMGDEFEYMGPDEFQKFLRADYEKFEQVCKMFKK